MYSRATSPPTDAAQVLVFPLGNHYQGTQGMWGVAVVFPFLFGAENLSNVDVCVCVINFLPFNIIFISSYVQRIGPCFIQVYDVHTNFSKSMDCLKSFEGIEKKFKWRGGGGRRLLLLR